MLPSTPSHSLRSGIGCSKPSGIFGIAAIQDVAGRKLTVETTAANCHDSKPLLGLLDKTNIQPGIRIHADKVYCSQKHHDALKSRDIKTVFRIRLQRITH
ncbi:MAG: transposase [Nitrosomonas sp.]|uniref:transposase n=1 Tax=Nitrosomonas sp. TaxID=42353 RepID=UPI0025CD4EC9|nr:transposase [Nitrosomonas sp.]UJP02421.1 MAG: transposase [Nitrosomonas sp.]